MDTHTHRESKSKCTNETRSSMQEKSRTDSHSSLGLNSAEATGWRPKGCMQRHPLSVIPKLVEHSLVQSLGWGGGEQVDGDAAAMQRADHSQCGLRKRDEQTNSQTSKIIHPGIIDGNRLTKLEESTDREKQTVIVTIILLLLLFFRYSAGLL